MPDSLDKYDTQIALVLSQIEVLKLGQNRILVAIEGDAQLGTKGLANRLKDAEAKIEAHDKKLIQWAAVIAFLALITPVIISLFRR